ncbi:universal stress protein [Acidimicrobiia bacterium EGI L10123]|uniref:universal stress protein n=1 Tax=Salinilacustrithrix flava TaxID=2957203 RepID=UPI003D7C2045|nr:universal stress protein [Acidimicrobiia bacterium EGI L10123]
MPTVVVPLDGSEFSERALRPGAALAARSGREAARGRLVLVTCAASDGSVLERRLRDRADLFASIVDVQVRVLEEDPVGGILQTVAEDADALLCMTTHGRGGVRNALLGSVSEQVVCDATGPIVLVGPKCTTTPLPGERSHVVVCSDGSSFGDAVLPVAIRWATQLGLGLWLVTVIGPDEAVALPGERPGHRELRDAQERLTRLAAGIPPEVGSPQTTVLYGLPAPRTIVGHAHRISAALIAMATHGRTGLLRTALGSVTADVVRHSPCPVLIVRPPVQGPVDR